MEHETDAEKGARTLNRRYLATEVFVDVDDTKLYWKIDS